MLLQRLLHLLILPQLPGKMNTSEELTNAPVQDMAALLNIRVFSQQQIEFLASGYAQGEATKWGQDGVFEGVLGREPGDQPSIIALAWNMNEFMGHIVCVIEPGSSCTFLLRMILTPDFLWLGLHYVGSDCNVPLQVYHDAFLEAIRQCPLAASAIMQRQLEVSQTWLDLVHSLCGHLGAANGFQSSLA